MEICNAEAIWKRAKWIWKQGESRNNDFALFRRSIILEKEIQKAIISVSAHNHLMLFVNGVHVTGYVTPAPSHPQKSKQYLTYDVTEHLHTGENVFSAIVHYLGNHGQNYVDGKPGFILGARLMLADGSEMLLGTDEGWKVCADTPFCSGTPCQQKRGLSAIEIFDARKEQAGWKLPGFDDALWDFARISSVQEDNWTLVPQMIPEGAIHELIRPIPVGMQKKGLQVFDAGKIVTGWVRIGLPGVKGTKIRLRYSEDLVNRRVGHNVCNEFTADYYDEYIMRGESDKEIWEPSFSYKAFRYVEIEGYPKMVQPDQILIVSAGTGITHKGSFQCDNLLLNQIYDACIQTQKNNVIGQMVDCPHREQAQYLADSDWQAETFAYNFPEASVLRKVLLDFRDAQYPDGRFPFVFPTNADNPEFDISIPEWDLHYVTLLWKVYYLYEDIEILRICYDTAANTANHYLHCIDPQTGLVPQGPGFPEGWNISDWPYPNISHSSRYLTVQNCLLYHVTSLLAQMASILGRTADIPNWKASGEKLKDSILKNLYSRRKKRFRDGMGARGFHQGPNVVAYQYDLVPQEDREDVLKYIADCGFGCSTLLMRMVLQTLFENGFGEQAYGILSSRERPGWGYMIEQGFQTVWEGFRNIESHSHAWNAYPARLMQEYLLGIRQRAPGFRQVEISPYIPKNLCCAQGTITTCRGLISVAWKKLKDTVQLTVEIPADVTAHICCGNLNMVISNSEETPLRETLFFNL